MLSRLALQRSAALWRRPAMVQCANYWSISSVGASEVDHGEDLKSLIARWDKGNKIYFGPDRDFENFPSLKSPEHKPAVRMGVFPDYWFDCFYPKTGVTGPYMFLGTGLVFLLSKEYLVVTHHLIEAVGFIIGFFVYSKVFKNPFRNITNKWTWEVAEKYWFEPVRASITDASYIASKITEDIKNQPGQKYLFEAKRENVDLQLECAYRQRLAEVHQAVKKRLDYQVERENAVRQFEQKHQVKWIIQNVMKSITPQQEKETLARCIQDLKTLSAAAKA